jgi:hypothetical protein
MRIHLGEKRKKRKEKKKRKIPHAWAKVDGS